MKRPNLILIIVVAAFMTTGITGLSYGFHSGGVGECSGCHSMHSPKPGGTFLLVGSDPSSTCLDCHASSSTTPSSFHVMTYPVPGAGIAPVELTPGGDFGWLLKTYTYTVRGTTITELGQTHGHNTVALDFSIAADSDFPTSPGGTFPTSQLACTSCHDPHGKWRRIGGDTN
jgi:hypothetical protein